MGGGELLGLTGTATDRTVNIVTNSLRLNNPVITKMSFARPNLELSVLRKTTRLVNLIATKSFCMGIDKPGVKFVHHFDYPENCEDYFQQVSHAGMDGGNAVCNLLFAIEDRSLHAQNLKALNDKEERSFKMENLNVMTEYRMQTTVCRHKILMAYFGEIVHPCEEKCDSCIKPTANNIFT